VEDFADACMQAPLENGSLITSNGLRRLIVIPEMRGGRGS